MKTFPTFFSLSLPVTFSPINPSFFESPLKKNWNPF